MGGSAGSSAAGRAERRSFAAVFYLRPRVVTVVAYLPTLGGARPVVARMARREAEQVLSSVRVRKRWKAGRRAEALSVRLSGEPLALLLLKIPDVCKVTFFKVLDAVVKEAYRNSEKVRELVSARALGKVGSDGELAEAYIKAWLKASEELELPPDDPDAARVSMFYWKYVWKFGSSAYVVQDPPWC